MSEELEQETPEIENKEEVQKTSMKEVDVEGKDTIDTDEIPTDEDNLDKVVDQIGHPEETETVVDEINVDDVNRNSENDESINEEFNEGETVIVQNYLDSSILDVKVISEAEMGQYEEKIETSEKLIDQYEETFADIRQQQVVTGSVVGITERDVLIDIGYQILIKSFVNT